MREGAWAGWRTGRGANWGNHVVFKWAMIDGPEGEAGNILGVSVGRGVGT